MTSIDAHRTPSDPPWLLENDGSAGWVLNSMANAIASDPAAMIRNEDDASLPEGVVGPMLTVGHGSIRVHLPVIGTWPLDRRDAAGTSSLLRELGKACHGHATHEEQVLPFMRAGVALAIADGTMPEDAVVSDDCNVVELCFDHETCTPTLHIAVEEDGEQDFRQIAAPVGPDMPVWRIPCRMDERQEGSMLHLVMSFAITDTDGITSTEVRVDAMDVLRIAAMHDGAERA